MTPGDENHEVFKDCLSLAVLEKYCTVLPKKMPKRHRKGTSHAGSSTVQSMPAIGEGESESDRAELADFIEVIQSSRNGMSCLIAEVL
jgi:hypothetical protein